MNDTIKAILDVARSQVGVREQPLGSNRGPEVNAYLRAVKLGPGASWCAAFVHWCADKALDGLGMDNPLIVTGYCPFLESWAKERGLLTDTPQAGVIFLHYGSPEGYRRACHTGWVTGVNGSAFTTVEGNSNATGARQGDGVYALTRQNGPDYRFIRVEDFLAPPAAHLYLRGVEGEPLDLGEIPLSGGSTVSPVRAVAEKYGHTVAWPAGGVLTIDGKDPGLQVYLRDSTAYANTRDLAEVLGLLVKWDGHNVTLSKP